MLINVLICFIFCVSICNFNLFDEFKKFIKKFNELRNFLIFFIWVGRNDKMGFLDLFYYEM